MNNRHDQQSTSAVRRPDARDTAISVVLPVFNEAEALRELYGRVTEAMREHPGEHEIVFVDDGCSDESPRIMDELSSRDARVRVVHFSRNYGHQAAVQAGLQHAHGDVVVVMDSDLQDDPAFISRLVEQWRAGFDVVYAIRFHRKEAWWKRLLFFGFYRLLNAVSAVPIPMDAGNFGLIDRRVAEEIRSLRESDRFYPGLRSWVGFRQIGIPVERLARHDDRPRVSLYQLFQLAKTAVFSFSRAPLSIFYALAALSLMVCTACFGFTLYHRFFTHMAIPGWTSNIITASFFGALNSLGIGVLGEYVVRIYDQVRARPQFIVREVVRHGPDETDTPESKLAAELREIHELAIEACGDSRVSASEKVKHSQNKT